MQLSLLCCPICEVCSQHISQRSADKPMKHFHLSGSMESWPSYKACILYLWSILSELPENIHFPYLFLVLEPYYGVKTTVAMGAWLNAVMTQELCWKGRELQFQSLFSSALLGFIRTGSAAKRTNSSGHVAREPSSSKSRILWALWHRASLFSFSTPVCSTAQHHPEWGILATQNVGWSMHSLAWKTGLLPPGQVFVRPGSKNS